MCLDVYNYNSLLADNTFQIFSNKSFFFCKEL